MRRASLTVLGLLLVGAACLPCAGLGRAHAAPQSVEPKTYDLILVGTVTKLYVTGAARTLKRWAVVTRVDGVVSGEFDGKTFTFTVHSPAQAGLRVGGAYVIKANKTGGGYVVDESALESRPEAGDEVSKLLGNWSGESVCVNREKFPACKDEQVVYRVAPTPGKAHTVTVTMDKLVNGKPETMAVQDFAYDAQKHLLTSEFKNSRVHLVAELNVAGGLIEGAVYTLPDRTPVRRIKLKKD